MDSLAIVFCSFFSTEISCGDPGNVTYATKTGSYMYGDIVNYTCNHGYTLTYGNQTRECQSDGSWTGIQPKCTGNAYSITGFIYWFHVPIINSENQHQELGGSCCRNTLSNPNK